MGVIPRSLVTVLFYSGPAHNIEGGGTDTGANTGSVSNTPLGNNPDITGNTINNPDNTGKGSDTNTGSQLH